MDEGTKPDYGLAMAKRTRPDATHTFVPFTMYHLAQASAELFTSTAIIGIDDGYCVTIDFRGQAYHQLLSALPGALSEQLVERFSKAQLGTIDVDFPTPVQIGIRAELGDLVVYDGEEFIPFTAVQVFKLEDFCEDSLKIDTD